MESHRYACNLIPVYIISLENFSLNPDIPGPPFEELFILADFSPENIIHTVHEVTISMHKGRSDGFYVEIFRDNWFYHSVDYNASLPLREVKLI